MAKKFTVHPKTVKAATDRVRLYVEFYPYERYQSVSKKTATVSGINLLEALKKMVDKLRLYMDSEDIEDNGWTADQVIERILESNGDGCDYIVTVKNRDTDEVLIDEYDEMETEDWDDEDEVESCTVTASTDNKDNIRKAYTELRQQLDTLSAETGFEFHVSPTVEEALEDYATSIINAEIRCPELGDYPPNYTEVFEVVTLEPGDDSFYFDVDEAVETINTILDEAE